MTVGARVFTYDVTLDVEWAARRALGGGPIAADDALTPEHSLFAAD